MELAGVTRKIDELGRIVIPVEIRNQFGINERDNIEIFVDETFIILKKVENTCMLCGNEKKLQDYKEKKICKECIQEIKKSNLLIISDE